jgi:hypothetical protein
MPIFCVARFSRSDLSMLVARTLKIRKTAPAVRLPLMRRSTRSPVGQSPHSFLHRSSLPGPLLFCSGHFWGEVFGLTSLVDIPRKRRPKRSDPVIMRFSLVQTRIRS